MLPQILKVTRSRIGAIVALLLGSGLGLLSWSQTWFEVVLNNTTTVPVAGDLASPAVAALSLAGLALAAALSLSGLVMRKILGVLGVILAGCVLLAAITSLGDPITAVAPAVTRVSGIAGHDPIAQLISSIKTTVWPATAIAGGVVLLVGGLLALIMGKHWSVGSKKYSVVTEPAEGQTSAGAATYSSSAVTEWDRLSNGGDPTG